MDADGRDADFKRRRPREGRTISLCDACHLDLLASRGKGGIRLAPGPGWVRSVRSNLFAAWMGGSSTTNNGPTARPAACDWARPGGGGRFETFPILAGSRRCLCPWIVSKGQPPRWIPPMKIVPEHPLLLVSRFPASAALSAPGLPRSANERTPDRGRELAAGRSAGWGLGVGEEMEAQDGRILWRCAECAG